MFLKYCIKKKKSSCKVVVGFAARHEKVPWFLKEKKKFIERFISFFLYLSLHDSLQGMIIAVI